MTEEKGSPGRVSVVTGGGRGLGAEICRAFAARGDRVVVADRDEAAAQAVAADIRGSGGQAAACGGDICEPADVKALVAFCEAEFGTATVLVTSAGIGTQTIFLDTPVEEFERILRVNVTGTFLCCKDFSERMLALGTGGRIVTISSGAGVRGIPGRSAYGASKAAVINMTRVMAAELGQLTVAQNLPAITVNSIAPGPVASDLTMRMHTAETRRAYTGSNPLGRYGEAREIAAAALFLTGENSGYVNGETLVVDGGQSAAGPLFHVERKNLA